MFLRARYLPNRFSFHCFLLHPCLEYLTFSIARRPTTGMGYQTGWRASQLRLTGFPKSCVLEFGIPPVTKAIP